MYIINDRLYNLESEKMAEINLAYEAASKYFNRNKD